MSDEKIAPQGYVQSDPPISEPGYKIPKKEGKDNNKEYYQTYLAERKMLIDAERDTAQQFDKAILTLAAGALALSITFINQIVPKPLKPGGIFFLIMAWSLFCLSILSTLYGLNQGKGWAKE